MITRDRALLQPNGEPTPELLRSVLNEFSKDAERRDQLLAYFNGEHAIESRSRAKGLPNNKLAHDFPGYIVSMATGYLVGNAVSYSGADDDKALGVIQDAYKRCSADGVDSELATEASIYGVGVAICYAGRDSMPHVAKVDRRQAFVVYDDTVEAAPLFGVHWMEKKDAEGAKAGIRAFVYTATQIIPFEGQGLDTMSEVPGTVTTDAEGKEIVTGGRVDHYFGAVPIVEYWNNPQEKGDFEKVLSLIDAYDMLQSDRVNDKTQFVNALLVLYGLAGLAPAEDEVPPPDPENPDAPAAPVKKDTRTAGQRIRDEGVLFIPDNAKAEYLAKQLDEADVEVLKNAIKSDIHKFSQVPDLTDEKFAGNSSGVAMKYKLLGLEQLTKIKERWFREALRQRLRLFAAFLAVKGTIATYDADAVTMTFTRALPVNEVELAQVVRDLQNTVPDEILLGLLPFISDVKKALQMLEEQKTKAAEMQQKIFGSQYPDANKDGADKKDPPADDGEE